MNTVISIYKKYLLLFLIPVLFACEKKKSAENNLSLKNTFRMRIGTEPPTLDWNKATDHTSGRIIDNIMDGLVEYDFSNSQKINYKMALAKSITTPNQGQKWIITLKENVYWTDGVPFNGQHVMDGWERLLNPNTASAYAYFLFFIKNAKQYNEGKIKDFSKVGVKLTRSGQLIVELTAKRIFFPFNLTHSTTYPIRKDIIEKHKGQWTDPKNIITLGPYILDTWEHDKLLVLKKNTSYYQSIPGNVENITMKIITEPSTAMNLMDAGQLDYLEDLMMKQYPVLKNRSDFVSTPQLVTGYYGFQVTTPPLDNVKIRKAISMAIDRSQIIKIFHDQAVELKSFIPKGMMGFNRQIGLPFNPNKARQLLEEFGGASALPKITISYNTNENHKRVAENMQAQLKKNLGIQVELLNEEWKTYITTLRSGNSMIYRMGWVPDYPDPHNYMNVLTSDSENNYTRWKNPQYDQWIQKAASLTNIKQRQQLYNKAQKLLLETEAVVFPIYASKGTKLISSRVKYFPHNIMSKLVLKDILLH